MKTKIILGLGLCLLLTVINLHRAMDNYGITDAKFKVGVLADESSSSGGGSAYFIYDTILDISVDAEFGEAILPEIFYMVLYNDYMTTNIDHVFFLCDGKRKCTLGGNYGCIERDLSNPTVQDLYAYLGGGFADATSAVFSVFERSTY